MHGICVIYEYLKTYNSKQTIIIIKKEYLLGTM